MLLICVVSGKEFLYEAKLFFLQGYTNLEIHHSEHSVGKCQGLAVTSLNRWSDEVVCKKGLTHLIPEARVISNAPNEIESDKYTRFIIYSGYGLSLNRGREGGNIHFSLGRLSHGKQVESTDLSRDGTVAQLLLILHSIESYWHSSLCGKHLGIDLDVFRNRLSYIFHGEPKHQDWLLSRGVIHPVQPNWFRFDRKPRTLRNFGLPLHFFQLSIENKEATKSECRDCQTNDYSNYFQPKSNSVAPILYGTVALFGAVVFSYFYWQAHYCLRFGLGLLLSLAGIGLLIFLCGLCMLLYCLLDFAEPSTNGVFDARHGNTVTQKLLTTPYYCNTLIAIGRQYMANVLSTEKQSTIIGLLAEGSSIRSIERVTGVHRDTIMRLGVRVGKGCKTLLESKMRDLPCKQLQFDEIWGFIGKKERHVRKDDSPEMGDVWTFCAIDSDTKLVPSFKCGKRDLITANAFVSDVAGRLRNRVQISSDALRAYVDAIEMNFGADVDFAQIIKTYVTDDSHIPERRFSAPEIVITEKKAVTGFPDLRLASTSHIERLNGTTRLHMRRLTRLTYAFSKKLENFEAAVALHFAYYNFVKRHITLRATPAMAAGIERDFWTVGNLVEATV